MTAMMASSHAPQATKEGAIGVGIREGEEELKQHESSQADSHSTRRST